VEQLRAVLDRFGLQVADAGTQVLDETAVGELVGTDSVTASIDLMALRRVTGDDPQFTADLAQSFIDTCETLLAQLRDCAANADRERMCRLAHSLKGASASIHAMPLVQLCRSLETEAASLSAAELERALTRLGRESQRVTQALQSCTSARLRAAARR